MELLSPAGTMEALIAAVQNGADAVYLGAEHFSARQSAGNFSQDALREAVEYCHVRNVKVYLAINTLFRDEELPEVQQLALYSSQIGIDAFIVQDLGLVSLLKQWNLQVPLHGSTQMTVHNLEGVRLLEKQGFQRVVLARECTADEIAFIARNTSIEIEVFVHGALCVSYSGQCLMSSFIGGRSGNRGSCAQPCRLPYTIGGQKAYYLSTKDMSLADEMVGLKRAGVTSLKIEGRMKGAPYVAAVTGTYRRLIDTLKPPSIKDNKILQGSFCRGGAFTKGWFAGTKGGAMMCSAQGNDAIHQSTDKEVLKAAQRTYENGIQNRKVSVVMGLTVRIGKRPALKIKDMDGNIVVVHGTELAQEALHISLTEEKARLQLGKLGQTPFLLKQFVGNIEEGSSVSAKCLNEMRRKAAEELEAARRTMGLREKVSILPVSKMPSLQKRKMPFILSAQVQTLEQAKALIGAGVKRLYAPISVCHQIQVPELYGVLPAIMKREQMEKVRALCKAAQLKGVLVGNVGSVQLAQELQIPLVGDYRLNLMNREAIQWCQEQGMGAATLSLELTLTQCGTVASQNMLPSCLVVYGYIPLMITNHCLFRATNQDKCDCKKNLVLTDRLGMKFPVYGDAESCTNVILNSRPLFMADRMQEVRAQGIAEGRLLFTCETPEECVRIVQMYSGQVPAEKPNLFTRGHYYDKQDRMV